VASRLGSLIISHKLLGTNEWFVIHHTNCGMETFTDEVMRSLLRQSLDTAQLRADGWHDVGPGPGSSEGDFIDWLTSVSRRASSAMCDGSGRIRWFPVLCRSTVMSMT
jgi:carbonic anhydrase